MMHKQPPNLTELLRARTYIDCNLDAPLSLAEIAAQANFSQYHFLRLFQATFQETPHQYLTRRRIERARELLTTTELSVTEVCLAVGFESLGSFSTLFQRHAGHSPLHYRRRVFASVQQAWQAAPIFVPVCFLMWFGAGTGAGTSAVAGAQSRKIQEAHAAQGC